VEEEFFFEGTAKAYGAALPDAPYKSRILVRRPTDPKRFNGTAVVDWNNVTLGFDKDVAWIPMHRTFMDRGYVSVSVAAQRLSIDGSPLALRQHDPARYGSLLHPGDEYSFDIFSQAAEAVLSPLVLDGLRPRLERRLAVGASQSASRLKTYINDVHRDARLFDGFMPQIIGAAGVDRTVAPVLWLNSQAEATTPVPADSEKFRLWEAAGPGHTTYGSDRYQDAMLTHAATAGRAGVGWDRDDALAWGFQEEPGSCQTANYYTWGYLWSAGLVALDDWVRTGKAPKPQPRVARNEDGSRQFDARGNILGGVRLPVIDAPIASYFAGGNPAPPADPCGVAGGAMALKGSTRIFDAATLKELYPTPQAYLRQFDASLKRNVAAGLVLPEAAADLTRTSRLAATWLEAHTR
jgi:hypothetical protein